MNLLLTRYGMEKIFKVRT